MSKVVCSKVDVFDDNYDMRENLCVIYIFHTGNALGSMCEEVKVFWEFRSGDAKLSLRRSSVVCESAKTTKS